MGTFNPRTAIVVVFVVLSGCGRARDEYPTPPIDARAETIVMTSELLEIGGDRFTADYGAITVPENRSKAGSRLIHLPFLRIRALHKTGAEPIFGFSGGPGQSNIAWDLGKARAFLDEHDFVAVGYRGVDGSVLLDCPEVTNVLKETVNPLSEEAMVAVGAAWRASAERLRNAGIDLDGYTIPECIEDQESVCKALGCRRIDLLSESYGTRVAYLYGLTHPERIFRSVMIGVNPPGHFVWDPATVDAGLRHYADLWAKDSLQLRKSADLNATMRNVLTAMPRHWLFFPIDPGKVKVTAFALLFQRKTAALVFDAFVAAEHGDPSGLALMSLAYDHVVPSLMVWGDLASKAVSVDGGCYHASPSDTGSTDLPLGAPMTRLLWGPLRYGGWSMDPLPEEYCKARISDVPTLLVSGSVDFSTPDIIATRELLPFLRNGKQVVIRECGHVNDLWYTPGVNLRPMLASFYRTGVVEVANVPYIPMDFDVSWSFPAIARAALGLFVCAIALFSYGILVLFRRTRRGRRKEQAAKVV